MANLEWDVAHVLVSPSGSLPINTPGPALESGMFPLFLVTPPYTIVPSALRSVSDNLSQADGESLQPPYIGGMVATLKVAYWAQPTRDESDARRAFACGADLREMDERLMLHLNALRQWSTLPDTKQRLEWSPSGADDRMLSDILLASWPAPDYLGGDQGGIGVETTFAVATPFPYATSVASTSTSISSGSTAPITNNGSAAQFPIIQAFGPSTGFAIVNEATGVTLSYDSTRPGASAIGSGDYAEIDCFKGTVLLNGDTTQNLIAGLDPGFIDFLSLVPGSQTLATSGASITVTSQDAYA
jgi:hypothetical protein